MAAELGNWVCEGRAKRRSDREEVAGSPSAVGFGIVGLICSLLILGWSLGAQGLYGVDSGGAAGGREACEQRHEGNEHDG